MKRSKPHSIGNVWRPIAITSKVLDWTWDAALKKKPSSVFVGSVPLDYHLHRRWKLLRRKRLSGEQTHVHHFSFNELDKLLRFYFEKVDYLPLSGTAHRYPRLKLPYNLFVRDIAWAAASPKPVVPRWEIKKRRI